MLYQNLLARLELLQKVKQTAGIEVTDLMHLAESEGVSKVDDVLTLLPRYMQNAWKNLL